MASEYHGQVTFSGLPLPGSTVTVTATQGSKKAVAITDDQGLFNFTDLADGTWTLDIEMTGFAPIKQDVVIAPNAPAGTFEMKLLTLEQIRAAANPVKVPATQATIAAAPAPVANPASPAAKTPAAAAKAPAAAAGKAAAPANGQPAAAPEAPAVASAAPDPNAQQASDGFLVNGSVNNAATSQFSMSQAFGNNRNGGHSLYNGGFSLIVDSSSLDAKSFSVTGLDSPKPAYNNLNAGFNFGGPLKIPHLLPASRAPNFYVYYQRIQRNTDTTQQALVPTQAEEAGNLSQAPNVTTIYAPTTGLSAACLGAPGVTPGAPFPGNVIPTACISSTASALLAFYPTPNVTGISQYNYQIPLTNSVHQDAFQTNIQKPLGTKNNVNGRFGIQSTRSGNTSLFGFHDSNKSLGINANAGWYHRFTQRLSMNASYTFSRSRSQGIPFFANRENVSNLVGITGNDQAPAYWAPPTLSFTSGIQPLSDGTSSYNRSETNSLTYYMNWNKFRHNIQIGGDFRRQEWNTLSESNPQGALTFTGVATQATVNGVATGGSDLADLLLGLPDTSAIAFGNADKYLRQSVYDLYANDDFRVSPELTINAGVRWEYGAPITELKGRLVNLDIAPGFTSEQPVLASNPIGPLTGQHYPTSLLRPDKTGVAPIVSLAWRPISGSSVVVRAGYGIYHDTSGYQATASLMAQQSPLSTSLSVPNSPTCRFNIASPFAALPCSTTTPDQFAVDPNFRVGYAQSWQLSAQRDFPGALQITATYLGIKGTRSAQEFLPNTYPIGGTSPCPLCQSGYVYRTSNGNSTREAGSIQVRRRLRNGFQGNILYTFSKSLDDAYALGGQGPSASGTINQSGSSSGQIAQDWLHPDSQRGLSNFDQRHVLAVQLTYTTGMGMHGGTLMSGWRGLAYKEWTVQASVNAASGLPLTPFDPVAVPGTGDSGIIRANYLGGPVRLSAPGLFLNPAAFALPAPGQWGNARRDSIEGPDQFSFNASMARTFRLHDRFNLDARLDGTNILNHVTYSSWNTTVGSPLFGTTPSSANPMRSLQVTLRLRF